MPLPVMSEIEYEHDFMVFAVNDGSKDYYLRLSRLIAEYNVVQLKRMEEEVSGRKIIALGPQTNTVDLPFFMDRVHELGLTIELKREPRG
jgi:hypothetical protein